MWKVTWIKRQFLFIIFTPKLTKSINSNHSLKKLFCLVVRRFDKWSIASKLIFVKYYRHFLLDNFTSQNIWQSSSLYSKQIHNKNHTKNIDLLENSQFRYQITHFIHNYGVIYSLSLLEPLVKPLYKQNDGL